MTDSTTKPQNEPERLSLSLTQVLASVLAAVSASVAASTFGVAGTVIGAALGSAVATVGSAVYAQSLKRSQEALRLTVGVAASRRLGTRGGADSDEQPDRRHRLRLALTPQRLAMGAGALFLLTLGLITAFELLTGQPVSASVDGKQGSGVSVLGGTDSKKSTTSPAPASATPSSTAPTSSQTSPSSVPSTTSAPTPTVTVTLTPSQTPSAPPTTPAGTGTGTSDAPSALLSPDGTPSGG